MKKKKNKRLTKKEKQKYLKIASVSFLLLFIIVILFANGLLKFKTNNNTLDCQVLLDAGHGGYDSGSVYQNIYEKDIALALTLEVGEQLENKGIKVGYTRIKDQSLGNDEGEDLKKRTLIANQSNATFFISIHTNASNHHNAKGFEVWYNEQSETLAKTVEQHIGRLPYIYNRGMMNISKKPLYLIKYSNKKTILIEAGFLESGHDREYLCNEMNRKAFAIEIANAIEIALKNEGE